MESAVLFTPTESLVDETHGINWCKKKGNFADRNKRDRAVHADRNELEHHKVTCISVNMCLTASNSKR